MSPSADNSPSRRSFLFAAAGIGALALTSCTAAPSGTATAPTKTDPLEAVLQSHVALRDAYAAALTAAPSLGTLLTPLHQESVEHVTALAAAMAQQPPHASSPSSGTASSGAGAPPAVDPAGVLTELRTLESSAQKQTTGLAITVTSSRAPLLGSIAASHACHLIVLG